VAQIWKEMVDLEPQDISEFGNPNDRGTDIVVAHDDAWKGFWLLLSGYVPIGRRGRRWWWSIAKKVARDCDCGGNSG